MSKVAIVKGDAYSATARALELTNFKQLIKEKSKIVIKPNLVVAKRADEGITTDVNVVRAILDQIPGNRKISIVEGSIETKTSFQTNGYYDLRDEYGVEVIDANSAECDEVKVKNPLTLKTITMEKNVIESDFLISVAKLKVHSLTKITGTIKNMMGTCPRGKRAIIHSKIPKSLIDLISAKKPSFGVIDGVVANEVNEIFPHPVKMGIVLASSDCVALDAVAAKVMGLDPQEIFYIQKLNERGFGNSDLDKIEIVGEQIENVSKKFKIRSYGPSKHIEKFIARALFNLGLYEQFSKSFFPVVRKIRKLRLRNV